MCGQKGKTRTEKGKEVDISARFYTVEVWGNGSAVINGSFLYEYKPLNGLFKKVDPPSLTNTPFEDNLGTR